MPLLAIFWPSTRNDLVSIDFLWFIRRTWEERAHGNTANMYCTKGQRQNLLGLLAKDVELNDMVTSIKAQFTIGRKLTSIGRRGKIVKVR
jgi:hypothetical protein